MRIYTIVTHKIYSKIIFSICKEIGEMLNTEIEIINYNFDKHHSFTHSRDYCGMNVTEIPIPLLSDYRGFSSKSSIDKKGKSLKGIIEDLDKQLTNYPADLFLILDDAGTIEYNFLRTFNLHNVPVLLWMHGSANLYLKEIHCQSNHLYDKLLPLKEGVKASEQISTIFNPIGLNNYYNICANSPFDKNFLQLSGVPSYKIFVTGNPVFSPLFEKWEKIKSMPKLKRNDSSKVLIVSTGLSIWGFNDYAEFFYNQLVEIINSAKDDYSFHLRLKPNERLEDLPADLYKALLKTKIQVVDNTVEFQKACIDYDIVLGDYSICLVEASFLCKPVVLLNQLPLLERGIETARFDFIKMTEPKNANQIFSYALSDEYLMHQNEILKKAEVQEFFKFDDKAIVRIAEAAISTIKNNNLVKIFEEFNYPEKFDKNIVYHPNHIHKPINFALIESIPKKPKGLFKKFQNFLLKKTKKDNLRIITILNLIKIKYRKKVN